MSIKENSLEFLKANKTTILIVVLLVIVTNQCSRIMGENDKLEAERAKVALHGQLNDARDKSDSLQITINTLNQELAANIVLTQDYLEEIDDTKAKIAALTEDLQSQRASTNNIRTEGELLEAFINEFPEYGRAKDLGIMDVVDNDGLIVSVVTMPEWVLTTTILDHQDANNKEKQLIEYRLNETKYGKVVDLYQENERLHVEIENGKDEQKLAFEEGAKTCLASYDDLHDKYIAAKDEPKLNFGSKYAWLGGAAIGAL